METIKIGELRPRMNGLTLIVKVAEKTPISIRNGKKYAVAILEDETGKTKLNLWRDQTEQFEVGDRIKIVEGFCHYRGKPPRISTWSKIEVLNYEK